MVAIDQTRCADCGRAMNPLGVPGHARLFTPAPQAATAGGGSVQRRRKAQKFVCDTCSTRRSTTNIVISLLLLGALLALLWYDAETKLTGQPLEAPIVRVVVSPRQETMADHSALSINRAAPPAARASVRSRPRRAPRREAVEPATGPADLEGVY